MRWEVRFYREEDGSMPVADFFKLPSSIGITRAEQRKFLARLERIGDHGLGLLQRESDILEKLRGEENLFSLRLLTHNNPRIIACALPRQRCIVLLHAFKEKNRRDYDRAITTARRRRDRVVADPRSRVAR